MMPLPHPMFEGAVFPSVPRTQAAVLLAVQQQLGDSQFFAADVLQMRQFEQIATLVAHIDRHVPYYGLSLRRVGIRPGEPITNAMWQQVPVLTRRALQDAGETLFATSVPASHGEIGDLTTSGTSGLSVQIRHTGLHQLYLQSFELREEMWHQRDLQGRSIGIRRDETRRDFSGKVHLRRLPDWGGPVATVYPTGLSAILDYRSTVEDQVAAVQAEAPAYLTAYPSVLIELLRHCRANGLSLPGLKGVRTVREVLSPETRALTRELLGVGITDVYSCAEAGALALQCPEHGAYHLQQENALIEVLDDDGQPCMPGMIGRVVVTPLHNFAMPLLRYEIGDLAEVGEPCPCGRTLPVIARIVGRARDMLTLPDGGKRYPYYGHNALVAIRAIRQHQVIQRSVYDIEIKLVVSRPLTAEEEGRIKAIATGGMGHPFAITLSYVDEIRREPSGKYAEFRSDLID